MLRSVLVFFSFSRSSVLLFIRSLLLLFVRSSVIVFFLVLILLLPVRCVFRASEESLLQQQSG